MFTLELQFYFFYLLGSGLFRIHLSSVMILWETGQKQVSHFTDEKIGSGRLRPDSVGYWKQSQELFWGPEAPV